MRFLLFYRYEIKNQDVMNNFKLKFTLFASLINKKRL